MFNFLVTATDGAWERPGYEYERSRFLEFTREDIAASFRELKAAQIAALLKLPCLFAYEGTSKSLRIGRLKRVELRRERLPGILCARHKMTNRSMYAKQEEVDAAVADDPARTH
ncbi:hypothetical protein ACEN9J_19540 [Variovorax sp. Varisp41]|uniref:hypothetical protein n=1 Tax=Variovorax sp. Varisp41 TaxID=3243033 RepID=UPI0039B663D8